MDGQGRSLKNRWGPDDKIAAFPRQRTIQARSRQAKRLPDPVSDRADPTRFLRIRIRGDEVRRSRSDRSSASCRRTADIRPGYFATRSMILRVEAEQAVCKPCAYASFVPTNPEQNKARAAVREAQARFTRDAEAVRQTRREVFTRAQAAGLTLRQIGEEAGLHHTTVGEIIRGE
jgi:hypothetical protein